MTRFLGPIDVFEARSYWQGLVLMKVKAIASLETMATVKEIPVDATVASVLSKQDNTFSFREEQGNGAKHFS